MQTIIDKKLKLVKGSETKGNVTSELITNLLKIAQNSDNKVKSEIENKIVEIGERAIPELIKTVSSSKGVSRGIASMSLIRIGASSISALLAEAKNNVEFAWVAEYLVKEIEGSKESILRTNSIAV